LDMVITIGKNYITLLLIIKVFHPIWPIVDAAFIIISITINTEGIPNIWPTGLCRRFLF
jgi:hypothetical protein